jgi:fucose 4-O-acetylase-like acetyltransferase
MAGALNTPTGGRDPAIDVARGIAIVLVVVGHNPALSSSAPAMIDALFLFHVPLFFLLSGLVQRTQPLPASVRTLSTRLLLPFLIAAVVVGSAKLLVRGGSFGDLLLGIAWGTGQTLPWSHLWFLPALFLALLITQALRIAPGSATKWVAATLALLGLIWWMPMVATPEVLAHRFPAPTGWPWSVDLLPYCLLFVWLGAWLREDGRARAAFESPWTLVLAGALFVVALPARVDLNLRVFTPPLLALLAAVCGCVLAIGLARALARLRAPAQLLATVGRHTLAIFLLHVSIQKAVLGDSRSWIAGLIAAILAIGISLALSVAARILLGRWRDRRVRVAAAAREVAT